MKTDLGSVVFAIVISLSGSSWALPPSAETSPSSGTSAEQQLLAQLPSDEDEAAVRCLPIQFYLRRQTTDGFQWEQAACYSRDDLAVLLASLHNADPHQHLTTVIGTLGVIGDPSAIEPLMAFVESGSAQLVSAEDLQAAKEAALLALGHIAAQTASEDALEYLIQGLDPGYWRRTLTGPLPSEMSADARDWRMVEAAVRGLGVSGLPEARQQIQTMAARAAPAPAGAPEDLGEQIEAALVVNQIVSEVGIGAYYAHEAD